MESNAWDRAQEAIDRAERRDRTVVTPDNAVSPFDASATTIIARPTFRPGTPASRPGTNGRHQRPTPTGATPVGPDGAETARRVPDPRPGQAPEGRPARPDTVRPELSGMAPAWDEPPTTPVEVSDPNLLPVPVGAGAARAGGAGSAARTVADPADTDDDEDHDVTTETLRTSPGTAPFAAGGPEPATTPPTGRRPWWRRLFGRG